MEPAKVQAWWQYICDAKAQKGPSRSNPRDCQGGGLARTPFVLIGGDLNDIPENPLFASLWQDGFVDCGKLKKVDTDVLITLKRRCQ